MWGPFPDFLSAMYTELGTSAWNLRWSIYSFNKLGVTPSECPAQFCEYSSDQGKLPAFLDFLFRVKTINKKDDSMDSWRRGGRGSRGRGHRGQDNEHTGLGLGGQSVVENKEC